MPRRLLARVAALACTASLAAGPAAADDLLDRVVATVGGRVITLSDLRTARRFGLVPGDGSAEDISATRDQLIDRLVLLEEVERYAPPEPDPAAIRQRLAEIRARLGSDERVATALRAAGLDEAALVQWVRNDLRIARYLEERFAGAPEPTDEDIETYVRGHAEDLQRTGRALEDPQVQRLVRDRVAAERHEAMVREWVQELRTRAGVHITPTP